MMSRTIVDENKPLYAPADDVSVPETDVEQLNSADAVMQVYEDQLIKFVSEQVTKMDEKLLFDGQSSPPLALIDRAIMQHEHVMLALTALYEQARWSLKRAKAAQREWYARRYLEVRDTVNRKDEARAKWYKDTEIDMMITVKFSKERAETDAAVELADAKLSLFRRLIDSWSNYAFQLNQLSKNGIAEKNTSDMGQKYGYEDQDPVDLARAVIS